MRARMIVLPHQVPRLRRGATGIITRIEQNSASAGSCVNWTSRRNTRLRRAHRQRRRPRIPAKSKSLRQRRPPLPCRRTPAAARRLCRRSSRSRRLRATHQRRNLSSNPFRKEGRRRQRQRRPLRKPARHPRPTVRRLLRPPPPQSYGPTPPRLRRSKRRSPIWFQAMPARTPSQLRWSLQNPLILGVQLKAMHRPPMPPRWRPLPQPGRSWKYYLPSRLG
jgi:hypothetical protein